MLPLTLGDEGEAVRDLQRRLTAAGFDPAENNCFGQSTVAALRDFQHTRGLVANGCCDRLTWSALVEAGYRLGDRLLYRRQPMLRGDDVGALQRNLGSMGFDAGRVDGMFGPQTERALKEFQRNAGLTVDGVCGRDSVQSLDRLHTRIDNAVAVAGVRERERLRIGPHDLADRRVVIAQTGGLDSFSHALQRHLTDAGARTAVLDHPDGSAQAERANEFDADLVVTLDLGDPPCWTAFYATAGFESTGGHRLADLLCESLAALRLPIEDPRGMRLPVLRETRMPAVVAHLGPAGVVVPVAGDVTDAIATAIGRWARSPVG